MRDRHGLTLAVEGISLYNKPACGAEEPGKWKGMEMVRVLLGKMDDLFLNTIFQVMTQLPRPSAILPSYPIPGSGWSRWHRLSNRSDCPKCQSFKTSEVSLYRQHIYSHMGMLCLCATKLAKLWSIK